MALTPLSASVNIHQTLPDEPNDVGGMTAAQLKAAWDTPANTLKEYLNGTLIPELDAAHLPYLYELPGGQTIREALEEATMGSVPDGSITAQKLASGAVTEEKLYAGAVTEEKIADGAVQREHLSGDAVYQVGDIRMTKRSDLDSQWLQCNGAGYSKANYPELAQILGLIPTGFTGGTLGSSTLCGLAYGNGYWVAVGSSGVLYYKSDSGSWTSNAQGSSDLNSVCWGNGYWVAVGSGGTLLYKAGTPDGTWTSNTQGSNVFRSVIYANGYWVAVGDSGALCYRAASPNGTWISNNQGSSGFKSVSFGNGYWAAVGSFNGVRYIGGNPGGAWTLNTAPASNANSIAYGDGSWVIGRSTSDPGGGYFASSLSETSWSEFSISYNSTTQSVVYANGYWVTTGRSWSDGISRAWIASALADDSTWATVDLNFSGYLYCVSASDDTFCIAGTSGAYYSKTRTLPSLSLGVSTYIKAL